MKLKITIYERLPKDSNLTDSDFVKLKRRADIVNPLYFEDDSRYVIYTLQPKWTRHRTLT